MNIETLDTHQPTTQFQRISGWMSANRVPLAAFAVSRIGIILVMYVAVLLLPLRMDGGRQRSFPDNLFLDGLVRWDSYYYRDIAVRGYNGAPQGDGYPDTNFFPFYPIAARLVGAPFQSAEVGGLIISNVSFLAALLLLYRFVVLQYDASIAGRTVLLLAFFPFSFYFSAMYTESLYLLLAVAAFYAAERDRWALAAIGAAIAGATRVPGITVAIGIGLLYLEKMRAQGKWLDRRAGWLLLAGCGTLAVLVFFAARFGDPLIFRLNHIGDFSDGLRGLWRTLTEMVQPGRLMRGEVNVTEAAHLLVLLLAIGLLVRIARMPHKAYAVWVGITLLVSVQVWFGGYGRYVLPLFPLFIAAALLLKRPGLFQSVLYFSAMLLSVFATGFASWNWIS